MRAIKILRYGQSLKVNNFEMPQRKPDQVLIRVKYSPINPSDVYFCKGIYGVRKDLPAPVGFEGVGTVVDCQDRSLLNQNVSFIPADDSEFGSWSEYTVANIDDTIKLPDNYDLRQGACAFINPFTSLGFLGIQFIQKLNKIEIVQKENFKSILFSSSSSAVSQMSIRLFQSLLPEIQIVALSRKGQTIDPSIAQVQMIEMIEGFEDQIKNYFQGPCIFFDSWAGQQCGKILSKLPHGSKVISYGSSSMTHIAFLNPQDLIFKNKILQGFYMHAFYGNLNQQKRLEYFNFIIQNQSEGQIFHTPISDIYPMTQIKDALEIHRQNMGLGKILLACQL